jgi:hypothetical protein
MHGTSAARLQTVGSSSQFWLSSTMELARKRPTKPLNAAANEQIQRARPIMRVSKMVRHDLRSMSVGELASLQELVASDQAEAATRMDKFRAQLRSSQRLNEYYSHAVAEIRASLDGTHHEDG